MLETACGEGSKTSRAFDTGGSEALYRMWGGDQRQRGRRIGGTMRRTFEQTP